MKTIVKIIDINYSIENIEIADDLISRVLGLMFRKKLNQINGLLIKPCNSIHTFFMRFNLDVLFISHRGEIIKVLRQVKPWRMTWIYFRANQVLELEGGTLPQQAREGMKVEVLYV